MYELWLAALYVGADWKYADCRLQERAKLEEELDSFKPTHVLNAAGITGRPNVDWCGRQILQPACQALIYYRPVPASSVLSKCSAPGALGA